jgi:hypothetical protein
MERIAVLGQIEEAGIATTLHCGPPEAAHACGGGQNDCAGCQSVIGEDYRSMGNICSGTPFSVHAIPTRLVH